MAKAITKQFKRKSEIDGLTVTEIKTVCENCGSEKIAPEGWGKKISGWTCWNCECSYDNSNKRANKRNKQRQGKDMEVSLEERAESIQQEKDEAYLTLEMEFEAIEMEQFIRDFNLPENQESVLLGVANSGKLNLVSENLNVSKQAVNQTLKRIKKSFERQGITKDVFKSWLYPDYTS